MTDKTVDSLDKAFDAPLIRAEYIVEHGADPIDPDFTVEVCPERKDCNEEPQCVLSFREINALREDLTGTLDTESLEPGEILIDTGGTQPMNEHWSADWEKN